MTPTILRTTSIGVAALAVLAAAVAGNAVDLSRQEPIERVVTMDLSDDVFVFGPDALHFETGKLYKLVIKNPTRAKHYFASLQFAGAVWTRKVETEAAEVRGAISDLKVMPGAEAAWYFVPVKSGVYGVICTIDDHAENGMVATIYVD